MDGNVHHLQRRAKELEIDAPPDGSVNYNDETVEYITQVGHNDFGGGDLDWVGPAAMQRLLQGNQTSDEQNTAGEEYLTRRDEVIGASAAVARIGGIGWDSPAPLLMERGKTVLTRAGVDQADVSAMAPVTSRSGTGSSVQVAFVTVAALERARVQVRAAAVVFEGQPRLVRAVDRLAEDLGDASEGPRLAVEKNLAAKEIRHGPRRVAFLRNEGLTWTTSGIENWPASLRGEAAAFAMGS